MNKNLHNYKNLKSYLYRLEDLKYRRIEEKIREYWKKHHKLDNGEEEQ